MSALSDVRGSSSTVNAFGGNVCAVPDTNVLFRVPGPPTDAPKTLFVEPSRANCAH